MTWNFASKVLDLLSRGIADEGPQRADGVEGISIDVVRYVRPRQSRWPIEAHKTDQSGGSRILMLDTFAS